jgi:hypothetical protein
MVAPTVAPRFSVAPSPSVGTSAHRADAVAKLSQRIALRFVHGATRGWSVDELAHWLREHRDIAAHVDAPRSGRQATTDEELRERSAAQGHIEVALAMVREVVSLLSDPTRGPTTLADLTLAGLVVPFVDRAGRQGFLPTHWVGMSLADRALSLVAVVYAVRPLGFELPVDWTSDASVARCAWAAMPKVPVELLGVREVSVELLGVRQAPVEQPMLEAV